MGSDYRESSIKRRDVRHTAVPEIRPPSASKRNTKRWCRGKPGVEHKPVCVGYNEHKGVKFAPDWRLLLCEACGKTLARWWPSPWFKGEREPPAWVK